MSGIKNREIKKTLTDKEIEIYKKSSKDILEFIKYVKIKHPNPKKGWLIASEVLAPIQKKILKDIQDNWEDHYIVLLSPRQSGKTTIIMIFFLWLITFTNGANICLLANKKETAKNNFKRFVTMYKKLPGMFRLSGEVGDNKTELLLEDGTTVYCSATTSGGIRGESATCVYWDEVCFVSTQTLQQSFFQSILPTIDTMGGGFICSSTPNYHDLFWEIWCRTQPEHPTYDPKWRLEEIKCEESYDLASGELKFRDNEWKEQRIRDLNGAGMNGIEAYMKEYGNSFDIQAGLIKFFNQTTVNRFVAKNPLYEWTPNKEFDGESIKIYEPVGDQHFLVGVDCAEGKGLNFSTIVGVSLRKKYSNINEPSLASFTLSQSFNYMSANILPDDFFNLIMLFLITHLNDQWYMCFEMNDIGRIFSSRLENLIAEIQTGEYSVKNRLFKDLLFSKFDGDYDQMVYYLTRRIFRTTGRKGFAPFGFKCDRKNNIDLKVNMKGVVDTGAINICDPYLLEEMRLFEDKRGGETMTHQGYTGVCHFDLIQALKYCLWVLRDKSTLDGVFNISPLKSSTSSQEQQYLEAILNVNNARNKKDFLLQEMERDNLKELRDNDGTPLSYKDSISDEDMGDITSYWQSYSQWFKRHKANNK